MSNTRAFAFDSSVAAAHLTGPRDTTFRRTWPSPLRGSRSGFCWAPAAPHASASSRATSALSKHEILQLTLEALARLRRLRVQSEVRVVDVVQVRRAERPGAALRGCCRADVDRGDDAG